MSLQWADEEVINARQPDDWGGDRLDLDRRDSAAILHLVQRGPFAPIRPPSPDGESRRADAAWPCWADQGDDDNDEHRSHGPYALPDALPYAQAHAPTDVPTVTPGAHTVALPDAPPVCCVPPALPDAHADAQLRALPDAPLDTQTDALAPFPFPSLDAQTHIPPRSQRNAPPDAQAGAPDSLPDAPPDALPDAPSDAQSRAPPDTLLGAQPDGLTSAPPGSLAAKWRPSLRRGPSAVTKVWVTAHTHPCASPDDTLQTTSMAPVAMASGAGGAGGGPDVRPNLAGLSLQELHQLVKDTWAASPETRVQWDQFTTIYRQQGKGRARPEHVHRHVLLKFLHSLAGSARGLEKGEEDEPQEDTSQSLTAAFDVLSLPPGC